MAQTDYTGVASSAKLVGTLAAASGAGTVITVDNATGWPTGATGISFVGCFDRGSSTEEKILFSSRSGNNLTIAQRGYDDTTAITHLNGATVEHTVDATILRTSSAHIFDPTRDDHTQYLKVDGTRTATGALKSLGSLSAFGAGAAGGAGTLPYVRAGDGGDTSNAFVQAYAGSGLATVGLKLSGKGLGTTTITNESNGNVLAQFDPAALSSGQAILLLRYHNGSTETVQRVTLGAADSGAAGFKLLRVPN